MSAYGGLLMSSNQTENNSLVCVEYNLYFTQCEAVYNKLWNKYCNGLAEIVLPLLGRKEQV